MNEIRDLDVAWLAGVLDGEGSISYSQNSARGMAQVNISFHNTSIVLLEKVCAVLASLSVAFSVLDKGRGLRSKAHWKPAFTVKVSGSKHALALLHAVAPHLTAKLDEALCVIEYLEWRLNKVPLHFSRRPDLSSAVAERRESTAAMLVALKARRVTDPVEARLRLVDINRGNVSG